METLVSIITPNYNSAKFIEETLESVLVQSYQNWEMIIVDDRSTDNGIEIINRYIQKDKRIKLIILDENGGAAVARNRAIEEANGRFIAFLDSDDLWKPNKLTQQISFMQDNDVTFSYSDYEFIDEDSNLLDEIKKPPLTVNYNELLKENQIGCLTAIYDQEKLGKCFMPLIKKRQDYGLWLRILKKIDKAEKIPQILAIYRVRQNSVSSNKIELLKYNCEIFHIHEKLPVYKSFYYLLWNIFRKVNKHNNV